MCYITATEFKNNLSHYMSLSNVEDVFVTKNNKIITVLTSPKEKSFRNLLSLRGVLSNEGAKDDGSDKSAIVTEILSR